MFSLNQPLSQAEYRALLASPLFQGGDSSLVDKLLSPHQITLLPFGAGEVVCTPQRFHRCLGIVLSGSLGVRQGELSVSTLLPSHLFGAAALYGAEQFPSTLTGITQGSALLLDSQLVDQLLATSPLVRENYLRYLTGRIHFLSGRLHSVAAVDGEGKLARYLLATAEKPVTCPATQLAKQLGMSRATLYRALQRLEETGAISKVGRTITAENIDLLTQYAT